MRYRPATSRQRHVLRQHLKRRVGAADFNLDRLDITFLDLDPGDVLIEAGSAPDHVYFVLDGLLQALISGGHHAGRTIMFYGPQQLVVLLGSLRATYHEHQGDAYMGRIVRSRAQGDSAMTIRAAHRSQVLRLRADQLQQRVDQDLKWAKIAVNQLVVTAVILEEQLFDLLMLTREEHYLKFVNEYPDLVRAIKSKELASLMGVTPEALSRIKGRIRTNNNGTHREQLPGPTRSPDQSVT